MCTNLYRRADAVFGEEILAPPEYIVPRTEHGRCRRQPFEDPRAVRLRHRPAVEQHPRPDIRPGADQSAESLFQFERGERHEVTAEPVFPAFLEPLEPRG